MNQVKHLKLTPHWFMTEREPAQKLIIKKERKIRAVSDLPQFLKPIEVAKILRRHVDYVYDLMNAGKLEFQPDGGRKLISVQALSDYLEREKAIRTG